MAPEALRRWAPYRASRFARVVGPALLRYRRLEARDARRGATDEAAWARAHDRTARGFAALGEDLGGLFVKLCQVAGARADVFPPVFLRELGRFHDRVTPRPFAALAPAVERELGQPLQALFPRVDRAPLAAASLAQVHRAWLRSGEAVVLKIQYPEAERLYARDLAQVRRAVALASRLVRGFAVGGAIREVAHFVGLELDFAREAESTERVSAAFADDPDVRVPRVHRALSTPRLLVLEHLEGRPILDVARDPATNDLARAALADRIARIYRRMIFEHGFFHGDPHPGNLLVLPDGRIGLLDFGLAKALPEGFAHALVGMFEAALRGDRSRAIEAARALGFALDRGDPDAFVRLLGIALGARHQLDDLRAAVGASALDAVPADVALVIRTLVLLNGLSERLAPGERRIARALVTGAAAPQERPVREADLPSPPAAPTGPPPERLHA
ncbi:MAG TPA: AarF/UbiB family protein [Myxococcota bacterium]|nr:AarF/UbiB family protein [Myxococcota bacterium]